MRPEEDTTEEEDRHRPNAPTTTNAALEDVSSTRITFVALEVSF